MNSAKLMTERGKVIGLGRVKIPKMPSLGFDCEIPLLSFVVIETNEKPFGYVTTCIHLQIDGYGHSVEEATQDMVSNVWYFLKEAFKDEKCRNSAWDNIEELLMSNPRSSVLWDKYHILQVALAKKGVAADTHAEILRRIQRLEDKVRQLEANVDEINSCLSEIMSSMVIDIEVEKAA